ncbi:hypothetical protein KEM48_001645 [Puccinia striiformis f. sp. tritici PST-130]|nr:hypothetical protein KEM48_001645 [Puccinia striiformis f. sp. tritici PST-130]
MNVSDGDAYQRTRRRLNAQANDAALARMNRREAHYRQLRELQGAAQQTQINVFDPNEAQHLDHRQDEEVDPRPEQQDDGEDDVAWVTLEEDQPDEVDLAIISEKERHRQKAKEVNWKILTALLHPVYMNLRNMTQNWAGSNSHNSFVTCTPDCRQKKYRKVDLVDVQVAQRRSIIGFCECTKDGVRLLQLGYLAGSPVKPARQLQKPFSAAVDLFRLLEEMTTRVVYLILKLTNQQILAWTTCPACFGPSTLNSTSYTELMQNRLEVCLDGNFQHRHQSKAGRNHLPVVTPRIFLKQSYVDKVSRKIIDAETVDMTPEQLIDCMFVLAFWIRRKFKIAIKRRHEIKTTLNALLRKRNPHIDNGCYTTVFFSSQWDSQRVFAQDHASGEEDRRKRLVALYKRQETLDILRASLEDESIFLLSPDRARRVVDAIVDATNFIQAETEELTRSGDLNVDDSEERKVRLLIWDAKSDLYAEAVHLQAESQPLRDPHIMGIHLGTHGKEGVLKAMRARQPAGQKLVDRFNEQYQLFKDNYADNRFTDSHVHPLSYKEFKKLSLDHSFWNDEFYYHSSAPWAIDPDVRTGINCVLLLKRIQEEFELIAQEVARAIGWAIALHRDITNIIGRIVSCIEILNNDGTPDLAFISEVQLGDYPQAVQLRILGEEFRTRLVSHQTLIEEWSLDIVWLWFHCQPVDNRGRIEEWNDLVTEVQNNIPQELPPSTAAEQDVEAVDDDLEEAIVDVNNNDGEDAADGWITDDEDYNNNDN